MTGSAMEFPWAFHGNRSHGIFQARTLEQVAFPFFRGIFPTQGLNPGLPLQVDSLPAEPQGKPNNTGVGSLSLLQGIFWPRNRTEVSCIAGGFFTNWAIREALKKKTNEASHPITLVFSLEASNEPKKETFISLIWGDRSWNAGRLRWLEFVMQSNIEEQCNKEQSGSIRGLYESLVEKSRGKLHRAQQRRNTGMLQAEQAPEFTEAWKTSMFTHICLERKEANRRKESDDATEHCKLIKYINIETVL